MNEALRNKYILEGFRSLTLEERASLRDYKPPITKEEREQLRVLESKSTPVVAWYAHPSEVRGPFCRWFTCSDVNPEYQKHVAYKDEDCAFAAAAMNNLIPLLDELDRRDREIEELKLVMSFPQSKVELDQKATIVKLWKVLELIQSENHNTLYGTPGYLALCEALNPVQGIK
jgi:hypothetical protein